METLDLKAVRRLALARAGLLGGRWSDLPTRAAERGSRARAAALEVIRRFGYLQLDTVSIAGARSHALVLHSRLDGFDPALGEQLLQPGEPLFEYWGHEASWIPEALYPAFEFRRRQFAEHPWWGDLARDHPRTADDLRQRIRDEGPLRSADMEGRGSRGWWDLKLAKKVACQLWSSGELAIRERRNFQRSYDLAERVIPKQVLNAPSLTLDESLDRLLLQALDGHGWATTGTLARTWRLRNLREPIAAALERLRSGGSIVACRLAVDRTKSVDGWIRPEHLELAARLKRWRPQPGRAVLLSPFDPVLWDRDRVRLLFGFDQILEIFKPAPRRIYGYYCLPVLAGERLIARFDLKAEKPTRLRVLSKRFESARPRAEDRRAAAAALARYAQALGLPVASR